MFRSSEIEYSVKHILWNNWSEIFLPISDVQGLTNPIKAHQREQVLFCKTIDVTIFPPIHNGLMLEYGSLWSPIPIAQKIHKIIGLHSNDFLGTLED